MRTNSISAFMASVAVCTFASPAIAQEPRSGQTAGASTEPQDAASPEDEANIIVVTGTAGGSGIRKQDASFAITTISAEDLVNAAPKSTAEVFALVPGVWAESSGGKAGANIDVRGLPGGGDAPFVTIALQGAPIYGTPMLSFFEQSSIIRVDETIASVEALRGGPNAVFGRGEPGVTLNLRLKEGGDENRGRVKYTISDYGLNQIDAVVSGPLGNGLYYMIGGYYSTSPGIRDAQFQSERGKQITAQITYRHATGKISAYTRWTDDVGQWYLPMSLVSGNNLGTFSQLGNATRFRTLQVNAAGATERFDFRNGRGWRGSISGLTIEQDLSDALSLRDNLGYTSGSADTFGLVPDGAPVRVSALPGGTAQTAGGQMLAGSDYVQNYGHWVVKKDLRSLSNDLSLAWRAGRNELTAGFFLSRFSSDDFWTLGNFTPMQNVQNGDFLSPATTCATLQAAGSGSGCWRYGIRSQGDAQANALYLADSLEVTDKLRIDAGVRREWLTLDYVLDSGPGYPDGTTDMNTRVKASDWAYTAAANYAFSDRLGIFARYSSGFVFPDFDDVRGNNLGVNAIRQTELGLKFSGDTLRLFATGFHNTNSSFDSVVGAVTPPTSYRTRSTGVELDAALMLGNFNLGMIATYQDAKVTQALVGGVPSPALVGNRILRQPRFQLRLSPSYDVAVGDWGLNLYGAAAIVDDRFGDLANTVVLKGFTKVDMGIKLQSPFGAFGRIHADNLFNSRGLTEGDPRSPSSANGRPILGRSILFSVGYDF